MASLHAMFELVFIKNSALPIGPNPQVEEEICYHCRLRQSHQQPLHRFHDVAVVANEIPRTVEEFSDIIPPVPVDEPDRQVALGGDSSAGQMHWMRNNDWAFYDQPLQGCLAEHT